MKSVGSARAAWRACRPLPFFDYASWFFTSQHGRSICANAARYIQRHAQRRGR